MLDLTEYDLTYNQMDIAKDITTGTTTLDRYLNGFQYKYDDTDYIDDVDAYHKQLDDLYKEAKKFADVAESKMYELDNILVADDYSEFYPISKADIFEFVD